MALFDDLMQQISGGETKPASPTPPTAQSVDGRKHLIVDYSDDFKEFAKKQSGQSDRPNPPDPTLGKPPYQGQRADSLRQATQANKGQRKE